MGSEGGVVRNSRGVISGLMGVALTNVLTWMSSGTLWYYSFFIDAIVFVLVYVIFRALSKTKMREVSARGFKEGARWISGVILGALLTIGVSALEVGLSLGGI